MYRFDSLKKPQLLEQLAAGLIGSEHHERGLTRNYFLS